jgi:hypothetical protein
MAQGTKAGGDKTRGGTVWTEGQLYLVAEVISDKQTPLGLGKLELELGNTASIEVDRKQLVRRVYAAVHNSDILFEGKHSGTNRASRNGLQSLLSQDSKSRPPRPAPSRTSCATAAYRTSFL